MREGRRGTDVAELIAVGRDREAARRGADLDTGGAMDPLTQLDQLAPLLAGVVAGITSADLDRPTPCAEFDVRGVLEHMIGGATMFAAAYRGESPATPDTSDPLAAFGPALADLADAITAPGALDRTVERPSATSTARRSRASSCSTDWFTDGISRPRPVSRTTLPPRWLKRSTHSHVRHSARCGTA